MAVSATTKWFRTGATRRPRLRSRLLDASGVAALHVDRIQAMTEGVARIEFDERENGPGSVNVPYSMAVFRERAVETSDRDECSGTCPRRRERTASTSHGL